MSGGETACELAADSGVCVIHSQHGPRRLVVLKLILQFEGPWRVGSESRGLRYVRGRQGQCGDHFGLTIVSGMLIEGLGYVKYVIDEPSVSTLGQVALLG